MTAWATAPLFATVSTATFSLSVASSLSVTPHLPATASRTLLCGQKRLWNGAVSRVQPERGYVQLLYPGG